MMTACRPAASQPADTERVRCLFVLAEHLIYWYSECLGSILTEEFFLKIFKASHLLKDSAC